MPLYKQPKKDQEKRKGPVNTSNKRVVFCKQQGKDETAKTGTKLRQNLLSCLTTSTPDLRLPGGTNNPAERDAGKLPRTDSECQFNAPGFAFLKEQDTSVNTHEVKIDPSIKMKKELKHKCDFFPKYVDPKPFKDQKTQTLYRESSAQTLPYLPEVSNQEKAKTLELFSLPTILSGDQAPGLHEVEILDRARKRWSFSNALKINFKNMNARKIAINTKFKEILEVFEWQQWIEREEYIQECQMMRLDIVIKMFDKREREMHAASKSRIEHACERIEQRRQAGLRKNEIEFQRGMRRLEIQVAKTPRKWVKQSPMYALGSPCSEFYGPMMRHGVDPARRNLESKTGPKTFDMRIDDLSKRVNMNNLKCPFRKLKDWSKPKQHVQEYEQNFCNEDNLQKLFEGLRTLRTQAAKEKEEPKCLRKRRKHILGRTQSQILIANLTDLYELNTYYDKVRGAGSRMFKPIDISYAEKPARPSLIRRAKDDSKVQDMENMLNVYEGSYIGWVMQFLSEEMNRLSVQRKLHFFSMLAQKERWRREAAEAGLRQKENELRMMYEELFQHCNLVNNQISDDYISSILRTDTYNVAEDQAAETVTEMAKQIDLDIARWLESFKVIQNPLTFEPLRHLLWDMVNPDLNAALQTHEKSLIAQYIIDDVIFPKMWTHLDPIDITTTLTCDLISRLIDDDLYMFSSDSESESPQKTSWREAHAILRKVIRQAVPGNRWKEETERIVAENNNDLIDDIVAHIFDPPPICPSDLIHLRSTVSHKYIKQSDNIRDRDNIDFESIRNRSSGRGSEFISMQVLSLLKKMRYDRITRTLDNLDEYNTEEDLLCDPDAFLTKIMFGAAGKVCKNSVDVFSIRSALTVNEEPDLSQLKGRGYRVMLPSGDVKHPDAEETTQRADDPSSTDFLKSVMSVELNEITSDILAEEEEEEPAPAISPSPNQSKLHIFPDLIIEVNDSKSVSTITTSEFEQTESNFSESASEIMIYRSSGSSSVLKSFRSKVTTNN